MKCPLLQAMKLDLEYKDDKISALNKELEELGSGAGATDEEVAALKRQKNELEMRLKDQASRTEAEQFSVVQIFFSIL